MKRIFFVLIIIIALLTPVAHAEASSIIIKADIDSAALSGSAAGNHPSFTTRFNLDPLPANAIINSINLHYAQSGSADGLLRITDRYSAEILASENLKQEGNHDMQTVLNAVSRWRNSSAANLGLLFEPSALPANEQIAISQIELNITYTSADTTPPTVSESTIVESGSNFAHFKIVSNENVHLKLDYGKTSLYGQVYTTDNADTPYITTHEFIVSNLLSGITYHYKATVTDAAGNATKTQDATFTTLTDLNPSNTTTENGSLTAPVNFQAAVIFTANSPQITLSWNPVPEKNIIQGYFIYKADAVSHKYVEYKRLEASETSFIDTDVALDATYYYYVRSFSNTVISPKSAERVAVVPATIPDPVDIPTTAPTLMIILAVAAVILFVFYLLIKIIRRYEGHDKKHLKNVLKDPEFYKSKA